MIASAGRADDFRRRAAERLRREPPSLFEPDSAYTGDHAIGDNAHLPVRPAAPKPAAVLVPVVADDDEPAIILTERATGLRSHSGQIAFPGGQIDDADASPLDAALREAEEEIGLERRHVESIGYLDGYLSSSGYLVVPCVALVSPARTLRLNAHEVAAAFEVPLGFLMDEANHQLQSREWQGLTRHFYAMPFGERYIWGVTAGILRNMYERLYGP
jgi:8-oxo-dGTP pyrophosphatase MutT (NUDIX family)